MLAYAVTPKRVCRAGCARLISVCGVASNCAGVPLAFTLASGSGASSIIGGDILKNNTGVDIYGLRTWCLVSPD